MNRSDTRTAGGRLVLNIMMTVAQWERETIVERTRGAMQFKRSKSERLGTVPYGFRVNPDGKRTETMNKRTKKVETRLVDLMPDQAELLILDLIRRQRSEGKSLRMIASHLNELQIPTKRGGPWSPSTIHTLTKPRT